MSKNHLIIGLGGTGGKIIRAFRKTIYQEFRQTDPPDVALGYLYVDSSDEMMSPDDPTWRILGRSVQIGTNSQLKITDANLQARLANIANYPGIKDWIGSADEWSSILRYIVGVTLGGQKRRLGRFLFACKADQFKQMLRDRVRDLQTQGEIPVTFHICVGLAGGTGSGSLMDVIAQIRDTYPDAKTYRIIVYALLPDRYPKPNWDTGNYHANGYAALMELNALSVGAYQPYDVTGVKGRLELTDPFNGCYLFTNENENGLFVDVDGDIPNIVGSLPVSEVDRRAQCPVGHAAAHGERGERGRVAGDVARREDRGAFQAVPDVRHQAARHPRRGDPGVSHLLVRPSGRAPAPIQQLVGRALVRRRAEESEFHGVRQATGRAAAVAHQRRPPAPLGRHPAGRDQEPALAADQSDLAGHHSPFQGFIRENYKDNPQLGWTTVQTVRKAVRRSTGNSALCASMRPRKATARATCAKLSPGCPKN